MCLDLSTFTGVSPLGSYQQPSAPQTVTHILPSTIAIKVEEYIREDSNPCKQWFDGLASQAAAKVTVAKLRMELGNASSIKWFDGIGE